MVSTTKQEKWNFPQRVWGKREKNRGSGENGFKILFG